MIRQVTKVYQALPTNFNMLPKGFIKKNLKIPKG